MTRAGEQMDKPQRGDVLLEVRGLKKHFPVASGFLFSRSVGLLKAVDGVSFQLRAGETLGIVGESGCGKSTTARMVLLLEPPTEGSVLFRGEDIHKANESRRRKYRTSVQAVFQDPRSSLNPRMRVRDLVTEPLAVNRRLSESERNDRVAGLLKNVGLDPDYAGLYPHEFSTGQRQRLAIARALSVDPEIIVLDEPVSALDVSIRAQIMNLLKDLQRENGASYLLIAHHLATVRFMCDWVAVMYLGQIVELAEKRELFSNPMHPYTKALMSAALPTRPGMEPEELILSGEVPSPLDPPDGCHLHPRCPFFMDRCAVDIPQFKEVAPDHWVSCHLY